jgi:hypothetical protein
VEIGAANGAGRDLDDRISRVLNPGIRHRLKAHVALAVPTESLHPFSYIAQFPDPECK